MFGRSYSIGPRDVRSKTSGDVYDCKMTRHRQPRVSLPLAPSCVIPGPRSMYQPAVSALGSRSKPDDAAAGVPPSLPSSRRRPRATTRPVTSASAHHQTTRGGLARLSAGRGGSLGPAAGETDVSERRYGSDLGGLRCWPWRDITPPPPATRQAGPVRRPTLTATPLGNRTQRLPCIGAEVTGWPQWVDTMQL